MAREVSWNCVVNVPRSMLHNDLRLTPLVSEWIDEKALELAENLAKGWGEDPEQLRIDVATRAVDRDLLERRAGQPGTENHIPVRVTGTIGRRPARMW